MILHVYYTPKVHREIQQTYGRGRSCRCEVAVYRISVRGKKWYWPHFINTIDILKSAACYIYNVANEDKIDELHFIRRVVCYYLTKAAGKKSSSSLVYACKKSWKRSAAVSEEIRTSFQHFPEKSTTQKRCRVCPKTTRTKCKICDIGLCMEPCFKQYHTSSH